MPFLCFCLLTVLLVGCQDEPLPPEIIKDPRTYSWSVDTLSYPGSFQTSMTDIWGSSPTDVYVVGHNDQNRGLMWHFDGGSWTDVKQSTTQGGPIAGPIDLSAIYGFSKNDIWAVGERIHDNPTPPPNFLDSSLVLHYDGVSWKESAIQKSRVLWSIWGMSSSDIWATGGGNTIYHYDGVKWNKDSAIIVLPPNAEMTLNQIFGTSTSNLFMFGVYHIGNNLGASTYLFFHRKNSQWVVVDSFYNPILAGDYKWGTRAWVSPSGKIYSCGRGGVFTYDGTKWSNIFFETDLMTELSGTADNNMFLVGDKGKAYHFNGKDWYQYNGNINNREILYTGIWLNRKETFLVGTVWTDKEFTIVARGK